MTEQEGSPVWRGTERAGGEFQALRVGLSLKEWLAEGMDTAKLPGQVVFNGVSSRGPARPAVHTFFPPCLPKALVLGRAGSWGNQKVGGVPGLLLSLICIQMHTLVTRGLLRVTDIHTCVTIAQIRMYRTCLSPSNARAALPGVGWGNNDPEDGMRNRAESWIAFFSSAGDRRVLSQLHSFAYTPWEQ